MYDEKLHGVITTYLSAERLDEICLIPLKYVNERPVQLLPSVTMGAVGPALDSVFMFTPSYLCEIRITSAGNADFDVIKRNTVKNFRLSKNVNSVMQGEVQVSSYPSVEVKLIHPDTFQTTLNYNGPELDHWLDIVFKMIPASSLIV